MNTALWNWPQWTMVALLLYALLTAASEHGKPREPQNFTIATIAVMIEGFILYAGGFWS